jgi:ParB-like nuclease domain
MEEEHMPEIKQVNINLIDANPRRNLKTFPWIEYKVDQLQRSFRDVGMWEGVIARPTARGRYEIAFGHHRVEAARRNKIKEIPLIVRQLSDEQMLQFMGRENGEDYNAYFLVMLNTWEAASQFLVDTKRIQAPKAIEIARLLGWTAARNDTARELDDQMNHTAKACNSAAALIRGGYEVRSRFEDMKVLDVENLCTGAWNRIQQLEVMGKQNKSPHRDIEAAKGHVAKALGKTVDDMKAGKVARRDLRRELDINTYTSARDAKKETPLFAAFGNNLLGQIERMLNKDTTARSLELVRKSLPDITENDDRQVVQRLGLALDHLSERADDWRAKLTKTSKKIVPLTAISGRN